ncbi:hypothetical protein BDQ17DRAFT_1386409 [Cyathus striatus]|nr:hypothetical protein BDQ17DRAFT_1386409 [Cyathus striatus]
MPGIYNVRQSLFQLPSILEENHERWHIFFNDTGFHNHTVHTVLALWSLGAHESILEAAYKESCSLQRPYYNAYLKFFTSEVKAKGAATVLENRFVEGLIHPLIHTGYGFEFGLPGLVAEGIAQTAVHPARSPVISSVVWHPDKTPEKPVHALTILARIIDDSRFAARETIDQLEVYGDTHDKHGDTIKAYVDQWTLDSSIEKSVEELVWMNTGKKSFNNDFSSDMHIVTSSQLSRPSQEILLRAYFATCLVWYIGRGRASIDVQRFYEETTTNIVPGGAAPVYGHKSPGCLEGTELTDAGRLDGTLFVRAAILTVGRSGWVREGEAPVGFDRVGFYIT